MPRALTCTVSSLRLPGEPLASPDLAARVDEKIMRAHIENLGHFPSHPSATLTHEQHLRLRQAGHLVRLFDPNNERMLPARPAQPMHVNVVHRDGNALSVRLAKPLPPPGADIDSDSDTLIDSGVVLRAADTIVTRDQWYMFVRAERVSASGVTFLATIMPRDVFDTIKTRRAELLACYGMPPPEASPDEDDDEMEDESESAASPTLPTPLYPASLPPTPVVSAPPPTPAAALPATPKPAAASLPPTPAAAATPSLPPTPAAVATPSLPPTPAAAALPPTPTPAAAAASLPPTPASGGDIDDDDVPVLAICAPKQPESDDDDDDVPISSAKRACVADGDAQKAAPAAPASVPRKRKPAPPKPVPVVVPGARVPVPPAAEAARQLLLYMHNLRKDVPEESVGMLLAPASRAAGLMLAARLEAARKTRMATVVRGMLDGKLTLSSRVEKDTKFGGTCELNGMLVGPFEHGVFVTISGIRMRVAPSTARWLRGIDAMLHFDTAVLARHRPTAADKADEFAATAAALVAAHAAQIDAVYA